MFNSQEFKTASDKIIIHLDTQLGSLRTGGASPQLLDSVKVEAYGTQMKVTELASITVADPTLLIISPWDASLLPTLEKAIATAGINLNPIVDGKIIRISVPPLTEETRQQLVKLLHQKVEESKIMLRTLRSDFKKNIETDKGQAGISEDDIEAALVNLEEAVKQITSLIEKRAHEKQKQLLKV
jgi:ribosome recycling factor